MKNFLKLFLMICIIPFISCKKNSDTQIKTPINPNALTCLWAKAAGGPDNDQGLSISTDANGNVFVAGSHGPSISFGTNTLTNSGMFLVKYNASGTVLWAKELGDVMVRGISTDVSGNVLVTGVLGPSVIFGSDTLIGGFGYSAIFVVKFNGAGNALWAKSAGGTNLDYGKSISTDASGNVFVTGKFDSPSITFGTFTLTNTNAGSGDVFLVKYDAFGNVLWAKSAGGSDWDEAVGIATDANGNFFLTGFFTSSSITFGASTFTNTSNAAKYFVVKYDASGNALWAKLAGAGSAEISAISTDLNGNLIVTGDYYFPDLNGSNPSAHWDDAFITKYDPSGNVLWTHLLGGTGDENGDGVSTDAYGNIFLIGDFSAHDPFHNPWNPQPVESSFNVDSTTLTSVGEWNIFLVKYDALGNVKRAKSSQGGSQAFGICTDANGNPFITGYFVNYLTLGSINLTNVGSSDFFIAKLEN